jgi:hypothetical protein
MALPDQDARSGEDILSVFGGYADHIGPLYLTWTIHKNAGSRLGS